MNTNAELLNNLFQQISVVKEHSIEENWDIPSNKTIANAKTLLKNIFNHKPYDYWIYPTPSLEIIIDAGYNDNRIIIHTLNNQIIYTYTNKNNIISATTKNIMDELPDIHMKKLLDRI